MYWSRNTTVTVDYMYCCSALHDVKTNESTFVCISLTRSYIQEIKIICFYLDIKLFKKTSIISCAVGNLGNPCSTYLFQDFGVCVEISSKRGLKN